ncbi:hypothetical protein [Dactylosporangium sp. NPDC005555]|uniref:hypothetical protein n=1 Tax=Dactylosporangium sp. NPDC005555 TaxID=3154889 RepID=UPI0033B6AD7B
MRRTDVVICLPQVGQERPRIGVVLVGGRSPLRVRWEDDGSEQDVVLDNQYKLAARHSLRYEWLLDPVAVGERIRADLAGAIIRSIEDGQVLDSRGHQDLLHVYGINLENATSAWKEATKRIAKRSDIRINRKKQYIWEPPAPPVGQLSPGTSATPEVEPEPAPIVQPEPESGTPANDQPPIEADAPEPEEGDPKSPGVDDMPQLADLIRQAAQAPLRTAVGLGRRSDSELSNLLIDLPDGQHARAAALLLPVPRDLPDAGRLGSAEVAETMLHAAADELHAADAEERVAAGWLLRRLAEAAVLTPASIASLARVIRAADAGPADIDAAVRVLAELLALTRPAETATVPLDVVVDAVSAMPLRPGSGRAAVIVAVARLWPDQVADTAWWRGASLTDVVDCAEGGLGGVTSLESVGERVIRPLVNAALVKAASRRALSHLLGLPAEFARQLPAGAVAGVFRRIGREDPTVAGWVAELSDTERADALRRDAAEAQKASAAATARAEAASQEAAGLLDRSERLEEMLRRDHDEAVGLRSAQERQIRIDVVRSLAELAAEVEELAADSTGPDVLIDRVRAMVAAHGLEPIGAAGADAAFDPAAHKPIAGRPAPGSQVTVLRPGYRWRTLDDVLVIGKALVVKQ